MNQLNDSQIVRTLSGFILGSSHKFKMYFVNYLSAWTEA